MSTHPWTCPDCTGVPAPNERGGGTLSHDPGCPVGRALDAMSDADREWFAEHPDAEHYWRDLLPGDLGVSSLACVASLDGRPLRVRVRRLADGVRVRSLPANLLVFAGTEDGNRVAARLTTAPLLDAATLGGAQ